MENGIGSLTSWRWLTAVLKSALAGVLAKHIIRSPVITKASYCFCLDRLCCWRLVSLSSLVAISCSVALSQDLFVVVLEVVAVEDDTEDAEELL